MSSSDPKELARKVLRSLFEPGAERRGEDPASARPGRSLSSQDPLLVGALAVQHNLLGADQLEECLRELEQKKALGLHVELIDVILARGWLAPESVTKLLETTRRPASGLPTFSRFVIGACLGEGASAVVYRAWDKKLHRWVALKVLRSTLGLSEIARERFRREAQASAGLTDPHVVTVHDAGEENGHLYLVMEYVNGRPLSDLLRERKLSERELLALLEKLARGVTAAHEHGIVHRDLKPANLLVTESGEPKVSDFGLAHLTDDPTGLTRTGTALGTPLYMSPEQVEGRSKHISPSTDVYALGAILYEILTRRPPHQGEVTLDLYRQIVHDVPIPPRSLNPKVSPDLEAVALKALEKAPEGRYPTAREFADDLRRFLSGEPVLARRPGPARRAWRVLQRHRAGVAGGIVLLLAVGASASVSWKLSRQQAPPPGSASPPGAPGSARSRGLSLTSGVDIPDRSLSLWYRADLGITRRGLQISQWEDQSGNNHNAIQSSGANQPAWIERAAGDWPAVRFDGKTSFMTFTLPVNGLHAMTIFVVSSCTSDVTQGRNGDHPAINWDESAFWGRVYVCPFQSNVRFRFGTTQLDNWPLYPRPSPLVGTFSVTTAVKNQAVDSLYINGALVLQEGGKDLMIGSCQDYGRLAKGLANDFFAGDIAEILVYTQALGEAERRRVEGYLGRRYALPEAEGRMTSPGQNRSSP